MSPKPKGSSGQRRVQFIALGVAGIALAAMLWFAIGGSAVKNQLRESLGQGAYRLETTAGGSFTAAALAGTPSAVFFGYTHCPDVCPTTLGDIATWQQDLGKEAAGLRIFFVTVDPERDSLPVLKDYLSWAEGVTGVTGPRDQTDRAIAAFRIFARKVEAPDGDYTMDHTASVLLFDASGHFAGTIAYQEPETSVLPKLQALLHPAN